MHCSLCLHFQMIIYRQKLAVKQLDKLLVLLNKNVIGNNFSVYAISISDFWNYLQIKQLFRYMEELITSVLLRQCLLLLSRFLFELLILTERQMLLTAQEDVQCSICTHVVLSFLHIYIHKRSSFFTPCLLIRCTWCTIWVL